MACLDLTKMARPLACICPAASPACRGCSPTIGDSSLASPWARTQRVGSATCPRGYVLGSLALSFYASVPLNISVQAYPSAAPYIGAGGTCIPISEPTAAAAPTYQVNVGLASSDPSHGYGTLVRPVCQQQ